MSPRATLERISSEPNTEVISKALESVRGGSYGDAISQRMPALVKGRRVAGSTEDDQAYAAEHLFRAAIKRGRDNPDAVLKSLSPAFGAALNTAMRNSPQAYAMNQFASQIEAVFKEQLGKSITLTSPNSTGLVPYDLDGVLAP
jgi:hypothetical protein